MTDVTRALVRLRVPLGFVFGALVLWLSNPSGRTLLLGGGIAVVGEALRIWAAGHLNKSREVTASGPYRLTAHPLYLGSSIMGVGLAVASGTIVGMFLIAAYLAVTIPAAIGSEEALLERRFGEEYTRYRRGDVHRVDGGSRTFSTRRAMANGEHRAAVGLLVAALLLALKATYNGVFWPLAGAGLVKPGG